MPSLPHSTTIQKGEIRILFKRQGRDCERVRTGHARLLRL